MTSPAPPLRILHLSKSLSSLGNGIVNVAADLAIEQAAAGHHVTFATGGGGWQPLLEEAGVRCLHAPQAGAASAPSNSLRLLRILRELRPDIVHSHMRNGFALAWPWCRLLHIPVVMHVHNIHDRDFGISRLPDRVIAVSHSVGQTLIHQGVPAGRVRVVWNGMLGSRRFGLPAPPADLQHPAVVTVAGMMHRKGIPELLDAFCQVSAKLPADTPPPHLYLVGGGSERHLFTSIAAQTPFADRIHFLGFQADPRPFLQSADLFVLPSRRESFGLAIIEARAAGCPVIGTDVDGIPEILDNGRSGVLVPPNDPAALATAMEQLLTNPARLAELRTRSLQGLERFSTQRMTADVQTVYEELL